MKIDCTANGETMLEYSKRKWDNHYECEWRTTSNEIVVKMQNCIYFAPWALWRNEWTTRMAHCSSEWVVTSCNKDMHDMQSTRIKYRLRNSCLRRSQAIWYRIIIWDGFACNTERRRAGASASVMTWRSITFRRSEIHPHTMICHYYLVHEKCAKTLDKSIPTPTTTPAVNVPCFVSCMLKSFTACTYM